MKAISVLMENKVNIRAELETISEQMEEAIRRNAQVLPDQAEYNKYFDDMTERFNQVKEAYEAVQIKIDDKKSRQVWDENYMVAVLMNLPIIHTLQSGNYFVSIF